MGSLDSPLSLVIGVLGAIALIAGLVPYFRAGWMKSSIEALRGDRDDLKERVEIVESDLASEKRKTADLQQRLTERDAAMVVLEKVVTGRDQLERVLNLLEGRTPMFGEIQTELAAIAAQLEDIRQAVAR